MKPIFQSGFTAFLLIFSFLIFSCSGSGGYQAKASYDTAVIAEKQMSRSDGSVEFAEAQKEDFEADADSGEAAAFQSRKLIRRADLHIRVEDPEVIERTVASLMEKYDAWPASTGSYENSRNYSIRVPSGFYDTMLAELTGLGRILWRTENAEDVTLRYYDLESRLATKRELLKTYQGYLGKAKDIDEIMTVESRIADLQREIDQTGTQFRNLVNLVEYSTIDLRIEGPVSASSYSKPTIGEKLAGLFSEFGNVASSALVVLTGLIIYGIPAVLILILLFWLLFGRVGILKKVWRLAVKKS